MQNDFLLELRGISKFFPGVKALDNVRFDLRAGELHALLGENGAGKSTLIKILAGIYKKDAGEIFFNGKPVNISCVNDARNLGISVIHQEISLVPQLSVIDNILLGTEGKSFWRNQKKSRAIVQEKIQSIGYEIDIDAKVKTLSIAQQQIVEIIRALTVQNARVVVMDEPTAAISENDAKVLFGIIEQFKQKGIGIIYISHRMEEVLRISDRITVFRDGQFVATKQANQTSIQDIITMMVGREITQSDKKHPIGSSEIHLRMQDISNNKLKNVNFELKRGEIHGLYGLIGSGRTELARVLFGIDSYEGEIILNGERCAISSTRSAMKHSIALVPENRKLDGLSLAHSISINSILPTAKCYVHGLKVHKKLIQEFLERQKKVLNIKYASADRKIATLSGGNQQKVVLSKWLATQPDILILDEPTRGIDIGSKYEIYDLIFQLAEQGVSIILISSELPEIINLSSRVSIMKGGRLVKTLLQDEFSQETILKYALTETAENQ